MLIITFAVVTQQQQQQQQEGLEHAQKGCLRVRVLTVTFKSHGCVQQVAFQCAYPLPFFSTHCW